MGLVTTIDNWAPKGMVEAAKACWPRADDPNWFLYPGSGKMATKSPHGIPRACELLLWKMAEFNHFPSHYPNNIFPDVQEFYAGGLHQMNSGVALGGHIDTEFHSLLNWRREVSMVLYLDDAIGGELDMLDENENVLESLKAKENRFAFFACPGQWHRVRETKSLRRALYLFWWSSISPDEKRGHTRALFKNENER